MNGILLIDKPSGLSSAEVVRRVRRRLRGAKVGHLGTLDPFASGVLPLCVGEATKIAQFLNAADKGYAGTVRLGERTDTGDPTGETVERRDVVPLAAADLGRVECELTGDRLQTPPMYSALKRGGVPLYRMARRGEVVERTPRPVRIDRLRIEACGAAELRIAVDCSKGTYVRVLAEEIAELLGTVGHLRDLRRTRFGHFRIEQAVPLERWDPEHAPALVSIRQALQDLPAYRLDERRVAAVRRGQPWVVDTLPAARDEDRATLLDPHDEVVAVLVGEHGRWRYGRVLMTVPSGPEMPR